MDVQYTKAVEENRTFEMLSLGNHYKLLIENDLLNLKYAEYYKVREYYVDNIIKNVGQMLGYYRYSAEQGDYDALREMYMYYYVSREYGQMQKYLNIAVEYGHKYLLCCLIAHLYITDKDYDRAKMYLSLFTRREYPDEFTKEFYGDIKSCIDWMKENTETKIMNELLEFYKKITTYV